MYACIDLFTSLGVIQQRSPTKTDFLDPSPPLSPTFFVGDKEAAPPPPNERLDRITRKHPKRQTKSAKYSAFWTDIYA